MKHLHFCTPNKLKEILDPKTQDFETIRTGWIPEIYPGDIVGLKKRTTQFPPHNDQFIGYALISNTRAIKFKNLNQKIHKEEISRYHKKFHPEKFFILISCHKQKLNKNYLQKTL